METKRSWEDAFVGFIRWLNDDEEELNLWEMEIVYPDV